MIVLAAVVIAVTLAGLGLAWNRSVDVLIRRQMRRQVVVELQAGQTFRGLLVAVDHRSVLLRSVEALGGEQTAPLPVDGELLIPRSDVKYMQRP